MIPAAPQIPTALQLHPNDNVAVTLCDVGVEEVSLIGAGMGRNVAGLEPVASGHKIALRSIAAGESVIKYGVTIGVASQNIAAGAWVHTHNCRSTLDERSHTLDPHSGAPTDTPYV